MSVKRRKIILLLLGLLLFAMGFLYSKFFLSAVSTPAGEFYYIKNDTSIEALKQDLVEKKYLRTGKWFGMAASLLDFDKPLPGRYKLSKGMSIVKLVRILKSGRQTPPKLVITKIRTKELLAAKIAKQFQCDSATMISFLNSNDSLRVFGLDSNTVMAAALPLTYSLNWNSTPGKIVEQLHRAYTQFWNGDRTEKASRLRLTPIEVTTIASIIEEETNKATDKPNIASTYLNRLAKGMKLQADPTVKFALKDFGLRRILNVHLQTPSPYNTYMNTGLPPGPICTPAAETIDAVLNAPTTDYLYFVANSNFDGTHIFTTNYADHLKYAGEYQKALTLYLAKKNNGAAQP